MHTKTTSVDPKHQVLKQLLATLGIRALANKLRDHRCLAQCRQRPALYDSVRAPCCMFTLYVLRLPDTPGTPTLIKSGGPPLTIGWRFPTKHSREGSGTSQN